MHGTPEVLCLGHDPILNRTRFLVLQRCFEVHHASQLPEALLLLASHRFDLVVLCYSLTEEECRTVIDFVHSSGLGTKVLALERERRRLSLDPPDEEFFSRGPAELLRKAASMTGIALPALNNSPAGMPDCAGPLSNEQE